MISRRRDPFTVMKHAVVTSTLFGLVATASACDKPSADEAKGSTGAGPDATIAAASAPTTGLFIDDRAVPTEGAMAIGFEGEESLSFAVADRALSCAQLEASLLDATKALDGFAVQFWLAPQLDRDGAWDLAGAYISEKGERSPGSTRAASLLGVTLTGDQATAQGFDIRIAHGEQLIGFTGDLRATRCPAVQRPEAGKARDDAELRIASKPIAIEGATVRLRDDKWFVRLTRAPHDCSTRIFDGYDVVADFVFTQEPLALAFVGLSGTALIESPAGSTGKERFQSGFFGNPAEAPEGKALEVRMQGEIDVSGIAVEVDGKLEAVRCAPWSKGP